MSIKLQQSNAIVIATKISGHHRLTPTVLVSLTTEHSSFIFVDIPFVDTQDLVVDSVHLAFVFICRSTVYESCTVSLLFSIFSLYYVYLERSIKSQRVREVGKGCCTPRVLSSTRERRSNHILQISGKPDCRQRKQVIQSCDVSHKMQTQPCTVMIIRGSRSLKYKPLKSDILDIISHKARLTP